MLHREAKKDFGSVVFSAGDGNRELTNLGKCSTTELHPQPSKKEPEQLALLGFQPSVQ